MTDKRYNSSSPTIRLFLIMNPALHYSLTDNVRTKYPNGTISDPHRLQLSIAFGLGFIF